MDYWVKGQPDSQGQLPLNTFWRFT